MESRDQRRPGTILAVLFIFYGGAHLLAFSFVWFILIALAAEGYRMSNLKTLILVGLSLLPVLPPLLSAYSVLRGRWWARGVVVSTCLVILVINLVALMQVSLHKLSTFSTNRVVFILLYGGASMALCLYGIWSVRKKHAV